MPTIIIQCVSFVGVVSLLWGLYSMWEAPASPTPAPTPAASQPAGLLTLAGGIIVAVWLLGGARPVAVVPINPRALFEESRVGVTRSDVRDHLRAVENRVPDTLRDMESRVPQVTADLER